MTEKPVEIVACKFCGEEIKATAKKCKHCGEFLDGDTSQQSTQPMINIVNQQTQNTALDGIYPPKNWIVALLLAIFFGWIGADRFYLGHGGLGILKLLTGGLFGIMWIIDIILIVTKSVGNVRWK